MPWRNQPFGASDEAGSSVQAPPTFLFDFQKLVVDGEIPQSSLNGHWIPPSYASTFTRSKPKTLYRWSESAIAKEEGCRLYEGAWWANQTTQLATYKSQSVFWSGNSLGFVTAPNDVSVTDIGSYSPPLHEWRQLNFCSDDYNPGLSRVVDAGELYLFGTGSRWINDLGMSVYDEEHHYPLPRATGLSGQLTTILAIIAFSCKEKYLEDILIRDRTWRRGHWRGHNKDHGRELCSRDL